MEAGDVKISLPPSLSLSHSAGEKRQIQAYPPAVAKPATRSASLEAGDLSVSRSMGRRNRSATPRISQDRRTRGLMVEMTVNICASLSNQEPTTAKAKKKPAEESFDTYESSDLRALYCQEGEGLVMAVVEGAEVECSRIATRRKGLKRGGSVQRVKRGKIVSRSRASLSVPHSLCTCASLPLLFLHVA